MVCSMRSCKMLLLQRISLLLNGLFFAHLLLLYYGGIFLSDQSISREIQQAENSALIGNKNGRMLFAAQEDLFETASTSTLGQKSIGDRKSIARDQKPILEGDQNSITEDKKKSPVEGDHQKSASLDDNQNSVSEGDHQKIISPDNHQKSIPDNQKSIPIIYMITPTVNRPTRKADFTRLAQTIRQVPNLHWIIVEDGSQLCNSVSNILKRLIQNYTYLAAPTPDYKLLGFDRELNKGIFQRNVALEWLRWKHKPTPNVTYPGVVYFADDDNTYDLRLFDLIRQVRLVAVWPVALVGGVKLEKPIRNPETGHLAGFEVGFAPNRTFAVDMAGFALGLDLVIGNPHGHFPLDTVRGWNEPALFDSFDLTYEDIQVLGLDVRTPGGLLEPLVWHTKTTEANLGEEPRFKKNYGRGASDDGWEV